jgi:hypothetical protein
VSPPSSSHSLTDSIISISAAAAHTANLQQMNAKIGEYEHRISELTAEIGKSQRYTSESHAKCHNLQAEIDRLSSLYDYEIGNRNKNEERLAGLRQLAEEKQIESAAIKFEFRKVQELKENLLAENQYLKTLLTTTASQGGNTSSSNNHGGDTTPSPSSKSGLRLKQMQGNSSSSTASLTAGGGSTPNAKMASIVQLTG